LRGRTSRTRGIRIVAAGTRARASRRHSEITIRPATTPRLREVIALRVTHRRNGASALPVTIRRPSGISVAEAAEARAALEAAAGMQLPGLRRGASVAVVEVVRLLVASEVAVVDPVRLMAVGAAAVETTAAAVEVAETMAVEATAAAKSRFGSRS